MTRRYLYKLSKMPSIHVITLFVALLLQSGDTSDTKRWVRLQSEPNITYDVNELEFEPELIAAESIDVAPSLTRLVKSMERDLNQFSTNFKKHIDETRARRSVEDELKMPRKLELRHQYGMLFNHQGYVIVTSCDLRSP